MLLLWCMHGGVSHADLPLLSSVKAPRDGELLCVGGLAALLRCWESACSKLRCRLCDSLSLTLLLLRGL